MKRESADHQNESTESPWPKVLRITGEEFQQSLAVAQLAVKLCELKAHQSKIPVEKENLDPEKFLNEAWELINRAREQVLRPMTETEYLVATDGNTDTLANVVELKLRENKVPFQKLCDPGNNNKNDDLEPVPGVRWTVYRSERAFYNLFQTYWRHLGEQWKAKRIPRLLGSRMREDGDSRARYGRLGRTRQRIVQFLEDERSAAGRLSGTCQWVFRFRAWS
jgi:hypothetical protein